MSADEANHERTPKARRPEPASGHIESVLARIKHIAQSRRERVDLTINRYAGERLLYRLGQTPHVDRFVLKGATLFAVWEGNPHRPTEDIDFLGVSARREDLDEIFRDICSIQAQDPIAFDVDAIRITEIRVGLGFEGHRVVVPGTIGRTRVRCQCDIGYGDALDPPPERMTIPSMLGEPGASLLGYRPETVVAEKLHAMVTHGERNSRFKDYFDLDHLARHVLFEPTKLRRAIESTFAARTTELPETLPVGLSDEFAISAHAVRGWSAWLRATGIENADEFAMVVSRTRALAWPVLRRV